LDFSRSWCDGIVGLRLVGFLQEAVRFNMRQTLSASPVRSR
jgi:hypothetical protein